MIVRFQLDIGAAGDRRRVEHVLRTLASMTEMPWRFGADAAVAGSEILVHVGSAALEGAPAARIHFTKWGEWRPETLRAFPFRGSWLLHPEGAPPADVPPAEFPEAWLRGAGFLLHREEELVDDRRDQWGCFAAPLSRSTQLEVLDQPMLNHYASQLESVVRAQARARGVELPTVPRWKGGAPYAAILSHDVDDVRLYSVRQALRLLGRNPSPGSYAQRAGLRQLAEGVLHGRRAEDPYFQFARWVEAESRHGYRSTFFVQVEPRRPHEFDATYRLRDVVEFAGRPCTVAELFRILSASGAEVALHASYRTHESGIAMLEERTQLESVTAGPCWGNRQHFLRFDARTSWTHLEAAGFRYDSTLGYNEDVGFRAGIAAPFRPWQTRTGRPAALWEVPLAVMDGALFRALRLDAERAWSRVDSLLERVRECGGLIVFLWHPNGADTVRFAGWWEVYERLLQRLVETKAWVAPARDIVSWWEGRELDS